MKTGCKRCEKQLSQNFAREVRARVNDYFEQNRLSRHANATMKGYGTFPEVFRNTARPAIATVGRDESAHLYYQPPFATILPVVAQARVEEPGHCRRGANDLALPGRVRKPSLKARFLSGLWTWPKGTRFALSSWIKGRSFDTWRCLLQSSTAAHASTGRQPGQQRNTQHR
jgi:hypothetical protein